MLPAAWGMNRRKGIAFVWEWHCRSKEKQAFAAAQKTVMKWSTKVGIQVQPW
jgi:hypothetical protein